MNIELLKEKIPCKWRVQSAKNGTAICVAYIDARQVMDLLDSVVGPGGWQSKFEKTENSLFAGIGIKIENEWVWKFDTGSESNIEPEKGEASDALKRAAVQWGIGRFLYSLPAMKLKAVAKNGKEYPSDTAGNIIWGGDALSDYCNGIVETKKVPNEKLQNIARKNSTPENPDNIRTRYHTDIKTRYTGNKPLFDAYTLELSKLGGDFGKISMEDAEILHAKFGVTK
jgi:hypothetical protein